MLAAGSGRIKDLKHLGMLTVLAAVVAVPPSHAASSATRARTVEEIAPGVHLIRHPDAPDEFPQSNTTVVIGTRGVLVVDSCYLPSAAREDIAEIRRWTDLPVRYVVNTHWHYDHQMGNAAYRDAFPGVTVLAHAETAAQIAGYDPGWFERFPDRARQFQKLLDDGKDGNGRALSDNDKKTYRAALAGLAPVGKEYAELAGRVADLTPDATFAQELRLDLGGRVAEVRFLGRGNTAGDAVVFLPKERILAAGDLVVHPVPYLGGGFPSEFARTLGRVVELDPLLIVPGHGELLRGTAYPRMIAEFLAAVNAQVSAAVYRLGNGSRNLDDIQKAVESSLDVAAWRQRFAGDDPDSRDTFDGFSFPGLVRASHAEIWRR
jgi:glyoxylase-like metal-dependent hydrolase (beta-lactamase superfamily II)